MKDLTRRTFIDRSAKLGLGIPLFAQGFKPDLPIKQTRHPLNILILGGTSFIGPHQIAYALGRGHSVSTFTRGKTKPTIHREIFSEVESLIGDRENDLESLKGRQWDVVIDNSGHNEKWTKDSAELLVDNVELYLFTSSTGVYYPYLGDKLNEDTVLNLDSPEEMLEEEKLEYWYGIMKTKSEMETRRVFGDDRSIIVRPTYMMGPGDTTDRFTYWPQRLARGGDILVPGKTDDPVQYIDARDVAEFMIRLIEEKVTGTFNAVGPASPTGMMQFVHGAHAAFGSAATFTTVDDYDFLLKNRVPYSVPWIMPAGKNYGSARASNEKAIAAGLDFRPLAQSILDIHAWWNSNAVDDVRREKLMNSEDSLFVKENKMLKAWRESIR